MSKLNYTIEINAELITIRRENGEISYQCEYDKQTEEFVRELAKLPTYSVKESRFNGSLERIVWGSTEHYTVSYNVYSMTQGRFIDQSESFTDYEEARKVLDSTILA